MKAHAVAQLFLFRRVQLQHPLADLATFPPSFFSFFPPGSTWSTTLGIFRLQWEVITMRISSVTSTAGLRTSINMSLYTQSNCLFLTVEISH